MIRSRQAFLLLSFAGLVAGCGPWAGTRGVADRPRVLGGWEELLPPMTPDATLPPLPERSPRIANYTIQARLDPAGHTVDGSLVLEWRNTSERPLSSFPFHLYWNAFRNNLSTWSRGEVRWEEPEERLEGRRLGHIHLRSVKQLGDPEADLTGSLRYVQPDDGNPEDRTVVEVSTPSPLASGQTVRFRIEWTARVPYGDYGRAGWVHDYHFIAQWFPKIGVHRGGEWVCHQFHPTSEFFADYGNYAVSLTLPAGFVVGATGRLEDRKANLDGSETFRFLQEDVHDFAWTASRRFLERHGRFEAPGYPSVDIRLLLQPEHERLAERYLEATRIALRAFGAWSAPYPYPQVTVVDPAWNSASGGMEYPTLFTGGASVFAPTVTQSPEGVTIHEAGHQFWYALVGNDESEEAWLDEGFTSYHDKKAAFWALGPRGWEQGRFGLYVRGRVRAGLPVVAPGVWMGRGREELAALRRHGTADVMAERPWEYLNGDSYGLNSYGKPALTLQTLEALVGEQTMTRILRTYARRHRFGHPTTDEFVRTVNEVTGRDYRWFFEQTWFSSELCDYSVEVRVEPQPQLTGFVDGPGGAPVLSPSPSGAADSPSLFESVVTVRRLGGVRMPQEVLVEFSDGQVITQSWDGLDRWVRFRYRRPARAVRAVVDPERRIAIDVDPANNSWLDEEGSSRRAATKWAARWMLWLQDLLELHLVLG